MAIIYVCDTCDKEFSSPEAIIKVEVPDGTHPHNGDEMTKMQDMCIPCIKKTYKYVKAGHHK